ncbi:MAG: hypothetical protein ACP5I1_20475, partial [Candidatus Hinthialibacter sp.]
MNALRRILCIQFGWISSFLLLMMFSSSHAQEIGVWLKPDQGIQFSQVNFTYEKAPWENSSWGRLEIHPLVLAETTGFKTGYINIFGELGWYVVNAPFSIEDVETSGMTEGIFATYFNLGLIDPYLFIELSPSEIERYLQEISAEPLKEITLSVLASEKPLQDIIQGESITYPLSEPIIWNAEGVSDLTTSVFHIPPFIITEWIELEPINAKYTQDSSINVEAAKNQCFPMSIANSLQYLEKVFGINVPHDHIMGLKGDDSLVGQLDSYANRSV